MNVGTGWWSFSKRWIKLATSFTQSNAIALSYQGRLKEEEDRHILVISECSHFFRMLVVSLSLDFLIEVLNHIKNREENLRI